MRVAFATLAFFTLFTSTAAQSPIITTSTSNTLSDDMQDDDLSTISIPENDDLSTAFDDSSQITDGSETSEYGIQSDLTTDDFASQVSPTPAASSSSSEVAASPTAVSAPTTTSPAPVSSTTTPAANPTPAPLAPPVPSPTTSSSETATADATPAPSTSVEEDVAATTTDDESAAVTPTPASSDLPTDSSTAAAPDLPTESSTTSPPSVASTDPPDVEAVNTASGATALWIDSWSTASTAAVGALGVIALRFGVFAGEL